MLIKGSRPYSEAELQALLAAFAGPWAPRDRALVTLGVKTGFRISELLSLRINDVLQFGRLVDRVTVQRRNMKKKVSSRTVVLHPAAKTAIEAWMARPRSSDPRAFLFCGKRGEHRSITRTHAWRILTAAYRRLGMQGKLGTHAMRKSFAAHVYEKLGHDLVKTQKAMGHASVSSTVSYLSFKEEEVDQAILED